MLSWGKGPIEWRKRNTCSFNLLFDHLFSENAASYPEGYGFAITSLGYGDISPVKTDKEQTFSFLSITSISRRVSRVSGPRTVSVEWFATARSALTGITPYIGSPLTSGTLGG